MFYSQFILAKKGPLGTIWIAAHLERKLRKNQVADTDIGLSVDSILFPEVPIALRLSSHLLLGVVRIYSKKVNYLFHDCSEALVKIKQAFRSTAVDLPPEESTAPYHSITLPETFDLDNFELPESALLSSNFVDNHVSTREQITLQDTVNGTSHPTSMFGLDERFGDDDASHIGLEFEQELFMDKHFSPLHASFSVGPKEGGSLQCEPSRPSTSLGNGQLGYSEGNCSEIPNELSELLCNNHDRERFSILKGLRRNEDSSHHNSCSIQTPDLNEVFLPDCQMAPYPCTALTPEEVPTPCLIEPAQGPSTPGLLEEAIPSNFQEIPALSPQERAATPAEPGRPWSIGPSMEVEYPEAVNGTGYTDTPAMDHILDGTAEGLSSSVVFEQRSGSLALTHLDENLITHNRCRPSGTENTIGKSTGNEVNDLSVSDQMQDYRKVILPSAISEETGNRDFHIKLATFSEVEPISSKISAVNKSDVSGAVWDADTTVHNCTEPSNMSNLGHVEDNGSYLSRNTSASASDFHLRPCTSNLHEDVTLVEVSELSCREQFSSLEMPIREEPPHICGSSRQVQGNDLCSTDFGDSSLEEQQKPGYISSGAKSGVIEPHELSVCGLSKVNQPDRFNYSSSSEFIEPEKMLAPAFNVDFPNDKAQQSSDKGVAEFDGNVDRISTLSKVVQPDHFNYFSSSEFLEPEKMLAPVSNVDFPSYEGQQAADKGVAESDGSVDRMGTPHSKKRQVMGSMTDKKTVAAAKLPGVPRSWRNVVPDDDDLLASILVGRTSQFLKIGIPLPPSTASSHKRPRTMPKVGMLKRRKVLVDDTMFLHADIIRQQLVNTEDIRRIRKKAPCTSPDIWRIHIYEAEDEIFKNCVLTGVTAELNSLECQRYDMHVNLRTEMKILHNSQANTPEEADSCRTSQFVHEAGAKVLGESFSTPLNLDHVGDKSPLFISGADMEQAHEDAKQVVVKELLEQMSVQPQMEPLNDGPHSMISEMEDVGQGSSHLRMAVLGGSILTPLGLDHIIDNDLLIISGADMGQAHEDAKQLVKKKQIEPLNEGLNSMMSEMHAVARKDSHLRMTENNITDNAESCPLLQKHDNESINNSMMSEMEADARRGFHLRTETHIAENAESCLPLERRDEAITIIVEQSLHPEGQGHQNTLGDGLEQVTMETTDSSAVVFMDSECLTHAEDESNAVLTSNKDKEKHANAVDMENLECPQTCLSHCMEIDGAHGVTADSGADMLLEKTIGLNVAGEGHNLKVLGNEDWPMPGTTCSEVKCMASLSAPTEHVPFTVEENSAVKEHNLEAGLLMHGNPIDFVARDSSDFCGAIDDNYAELLNVDDEVDLDVVEDDATNPDAAKLLENSGWSVRTRGVAKYLKNLFYEESVRGRKTVAVDRLLFGKTRKEASRMFFETLVLKSRDYIQVEQDTPFAYINIKPRTKLLESEF
ncbi:hypothetical protein M5K25_027390 [Dendrobium thyrsiflorum]|uniref:Sister chromatid cohesion 1 protein 4 n=1 Tax=Dendrobium thyrsiflorum TaxID=117978 RepID=A0ABD0U030_DENTH